MTNETTTTERKSGDASRRLKALLLTEQTRPQAMTTILQAIELAKGNLSRAALLLGISRRGMVRLVKEHAELQTTIETERNKPKDEPKEGAT